MAGEKFPAAPASPPSSGLRFQQLEQETACRRRAPVAWADGTADEPALPVDQIDSGRTPHPVKLAGDVTTLVEEHGGDVAPLPDRPPHVIRALAEAHEQDVEVSTSELRVELVDGR
jgi:hypothetical protein